MITEKARLQRLHHLQTRHRRNWRRRSGALDISRTGRRITGSRETPGHTDIQLFIVPVTVLEDVDVND